MNQAQLLASASSIVLTVLQKAGAAVAEVQQVEAFVVKAVQFAEQSGKSGADKLTAVLNATEAYVAVALPQLKADWNSLSVQIKAFIAGLVSLWNALGVFVKDVGNAISGAISTAESAVEHVA